MSAALCLLKMHLFYCSPGSSLFLLGDPAWSRGTFHSWGLWLNISHSTLGRQEVCSGSHCPASKQEDRRQLPAFSTANYGLFLFILASFQPSLQMWSNWKGPLKKPVTSDRIESDEKDQVAGCEERQAGFCFGPLSLSLLESR